MESEEAAEELKGGERDLVAYYDSMQVCSPMLNLAQRDNLQRKVAESGPKVAYLDFWGDIHSIYLFHLAHCLCP